MLNADFVPWLFGGVAVAGVGLWIVASRQAKKRTEALEVVAAEIGFRFDGNDQSRTIQVRTALFNRGSGRKFRNIMNGVFGGFQTSLFDYSYTISSGKSSSTYTQTVAAFVQDVSLPLFEMRPEGLMDRVGEMFVHKDINFDSHPTFSRRYALRGKEEERIRELFTPALLSFLEAVPSEKRWHIEGTDLTLLLYTQGKAVKPEEVRPFLDETFSLAQTFFASCGLRHAK